MDKKLKITVEAKTCVPFKKLEPFQGDLKYLGKDEYEKTRNSLIELGFCLCLHVWKNKGHYYLIDGHQRVFTVKQMSEIEGWSIPPLPVAIVKAKTFQDAKMRVLAAISQSGKVTKDGLLSFLKDADISYEFAAANFMFPGLNPIDLSELLSQESAVGAVEEVSIDADDKQKIPSSSTQVKQLQLYFNIEDYNDFMEKIEAIQVLKKTENVTDTVLEVTREAYKNSIKVKRS